MVNLTRIYTRTGDAGRTRLSDNSLTDKTDLRVQAYGEVDEANSVIGLVIAALTEQSDQPSQSLSEQLTLVQNELFDLGADLSTPISESPPYPPLRIEQASIDRLESWCDHYGEPLPSLRSFVLPSGSEVVARLHLARTTVRRAERTGWRAAAEVGLNHSGGLNPLALTYLNRLSDLLFILARWSLTDAGQQPDRERLWVPGGERHSTPG